MNPVVARSYKHLLPAVTMMAFLGCDQVKDITSGGGTKDADSAQTASGTIPAQGGNPVQKPESGDDSSLKTWGEVLAEAGIEKEPEPEPEPEPEEEEEKEEEEESSGRNVEQYARLPRNVTWKPVSASSGDNLTIILWGRGGGEKNYEEGSLRVEYDGGVKYPRKYVRRDDPNNGERAPKFLFDVRGEWFKGKNPVLFWNLGAYRIVNPERRQGKNE